jgi:hypothetical protein
MRAPQRAIIARNPIGINPFRNRKPVFAPTAFYGRIAALDVLCQQLAAQPPQCCAVVGLPRSGKTSLLYHLEQQARLPAEQRHLSFGAKRQILAVYVNAGPYSDLDGDHPHGALYFWRDLYRAVAQQLTEPVLPPLPADTLPSDPPVLDQLQTLWHSIAGAIRASSAELVLLLIDNAEGIARLPRLTASLLRTLTQDPTLGARVAYVATSLRPLYEFYEPGTWHTSSSFWHLFASTVYLGQLEPAAASALIARGTAPGRPERFRPYEETLLLRLAGRHLDLLTMACAVLYDQRLARPADAVNEHLLDAALPLCQAIWQSLAQFPGAQAVVQQLATNPALPLDERLPLVTTLVRLGVIEADQQHWRLFAVIMQRFVQSVITQPAGVSAREFAVGRTLATPPLAEVRGVPAPARPAFTHLEAHSMTFWRPMPVRSVTVTRSNGPCGLRLCLLTARCKS